MFDLLPFNLEQPRYPRSLRNEDIAMAMGCRQGEGCPQLHLQWVQDRDTPRVVLGSCWGLWAFSGGEWGQSPHRWGPEVSTVEQSCAPVGY